jgi:hypothetical protein
MFDIEITKSMAKLLIITSNSDLKAPPRACPRFPLLAHCVQDTTQFKLE